MASALTILTAIQEGASLAGTLIELGGEIYELVKTDMTQDELNAKIEASKTGWTDNDFGLSSEPSVD